MRRLKRKFLVLMVLVASLGVLSSQPGAVKSAAAPCCSWCFNICDLCETNPSYCNQCNNCLAHCNGSC
jgi:hypothetical protein